MQRMNNSWHPFIATPSIILQTVLFFFNFYVEIAQYGQQVSRHSQVLVYFWYYSSTILSLMLRLSSALVTTYSSKCSPGTIPAHSSASYPTCIPLLMVFTTFMSEQMDVKWEWKEVDSYFWLSDYLCVCRLCYRTAESGTEARLRLGCQPSAAGRWQSQTGDGWLDIGCQRARGFCQPASELLRFNGQAWAHVWLGRHINNHWCKNNPSALLLNNKIVLLFCLT